MSAKLSSQAMQELREQLAGTRTREAMLGTLARFLFERTGADRISIVLAERGNEESPLVRWSEGEALPLEAKPRMEGVFSVKANNLMAGGKAQFTPIVIDDLSRALIDPAVTRVLGECGVRSFALIPLYLLNQLSGWTELHFTRGYHHFRREDLILVERALDQLSIALARLYSEPAQPAPSAALGDWGPVLEQSSLIFARTDARFNPLVVTGDTLRLFGIEAQQLIGSNEVWSQFVQADDLKRLAVEIRGMGAHPREISRELRTINRATGEQRWISVRAIPRSAPDGTLAGWDGVGIEVTAKKLMEEELSVQSSRVEALYEVSRSLPFNVDPALVALRGLKALLRATNSDSGFACFYDAGSGNLELVATEGLSSAYLRQAPEVINGRSLVRHAVESSRGIILDNIQRDHRAAVDLARSEGLKSAIIMPLVFEQEVLGALGLFCKRASRYRKADFDLVEAACRQVALASRQADTYAAEKRQANSLAALYRLTHQLSRFLTPREIVEHAFPIIQQEFAFKRMWLGVLNEQGTHLVGQGGVGPGVRGRLLSMQIELDLRHDFLDEALRNRKPVIVKAGQGMECSGLNRIMQRLKPGTFIVVPLVSLGQVVGVLIVEPATPKRFFAQKKLPLLTSMASEIGSVILARRFESKMADAAKMKMASLLASGVAHNFNNLLQAVMGQASLIEMQSPPGSLLSSAGRTIIDAAGKGAALIKQLLSFTMQGSHDRRPIGPHELFGESREFYESVLGAGIKLEIDLQENSPQIMGDYSQIQQVITNLLVNAKEAVGARDNGLVRIVTRRVRVQSGEVDPELAPGQYLRIDIEDNGVGMDAEKVARCFEPFYTTKNVDSSTGLGFEGSGLGLSSAYSVVKTHDGVITVRSTPGAGSVFSVYLPAHAQRQRSSMEKQVGSAGDPSQAMVIDPARSITVQVSTTLGALGIDLAHFESSERDLEYLRAHRGVIRLVVIDVDHSGYNVPSFIRLLHHESRTVKVIVACADSKRWGLSLNGLENVFVVEKPLGARNLRPLLEKLELLGGLRAQVLVARADPAAPGANSLPSEEQTHDVLDPVRHDKRS